MLVLLCCSLGMLGPLAGMCEVAALEDSWKTAGGGSGTPGS